MYPFTWPNPPSFVQYCPWARHWKKRWWGGGGDLTPYPQTSPLPLTVDKICTIVSKLNLLQPSNPKPNPQSTLLLQSPSSKPLFPTLLTILSVLPSAPVLLPLVVARARPPFYHTTYIIFPRSHPSVCHWLASARARPPFPCTTHII